MVIAVCTDCQSDYEMIGNAVEEYAQSKNYEMIPRMFHAGEYQKEQTVFWYPITIFALDDVMNQELSILARDLSKKSQFVWIGQDKRFGVASYRVLAANFLLRPVTKEGIWDSLDRCVRRLEREGINTPRIRTENHGAEHFYGERIL